MALAQVTTSKEMIEKQFAFDGEWIPDHDPSKIGESNFAQLDNLRYTDQGISVIEGYDAITTNPINATYKYPSSGIQMRTPFTTGSYIIVQCWNAAETASRIYVNTTTPPTASDFETDPIYTPDADGQQARFATLPRGVGYCNEIESCVWEGDEAYAGSVILTDAATGLSLANPRDFSSEMSNRLTTSAEIMGVLATARQYLIGTTRPAQAFYIEIETANATNPTTLAVEEWSSNTWTTVTTIVDGTKTGAISHATSGWITFDSTVATANAVYLENTMLYYYRITISDGTCEISRILADMPFQECVDIWDGVYRTCIAAFALVNTVGPGDYTLEINEPSNIDFPIGMRIGQFFTDAGDLIHFCFEEPQTALDVKMMAEVVNTNASNAVIKYWDGDSWEAVAGLIDGTKVATETLGQSGTLTWSPVARGLEKQHERYGITGYWYQLTTSAALSGADSEAILIDFIQGVPTPRPVYGMRFPARFQGRMFRGCDVQADELNALDYTASATIDVHNGLDTSDRGQRIYVGGPEELMAATPIYNRFGSSIYETLLIFKQSETHLLWGTNPGDFKLFQISQSYGCPAPLTLASAEMGYEMAEGAFRNIAIWLSYRGPVIFDGAVIIPIRGIDLYFDPRKTDTVINDTYMQDSFAWFDPFWMEYNLVIPSGDATRPDTQLVYDLLRKRWWKCVYDGGSDDLPQFGFIAKDDAGSVYPYLIRDDGHMLRFGFGTDWDGNDLVHRVKTADLFPSGSIWHETKIVEFKLAHQLPDFETIDQEIDINILYYPNGEDTSNTLNVMSLTLADEQVEKNLLAEDGEEILTEAGENIIIDVLVGRRYKRENQSLNRIARSHQFEFYRTSTTLSWAGNFGKNFLWWGFLAEVEGYDLRTR